MWAAVARAGIYTVVAVFLMWALTMVLDPILSLADSGPNAGAESVVRVGSYFDGLTLENLVLIALIGVAVFLIYRAVVERRGAF